MIPALAFALLAAQPGTHFAPPIGKPLHYRQTEHSIGKDGADVTLTVTEQVDFARDGGGYIMTIRALGADAKAPPASVASFQAALRPFVGVPIRLHLSASGEPGELVDGAASWAKLAAAMKAAADTAPADRHAALEQTAQDFAGLPQEQRDATMMAPALALLGLTPPDLAVGASAPLDESVETPFGAPLTAQGTIHRIPDEGGARHYVRDLATSPEDAAHLADALRADAAADASGADAATRAQVDQDVAAVTALRIHEKGALAVSIATGLPISSTKHTAALDPYAPGGEHPIADDELQLLP